MLNIKICKNKIPVVHHITNYVTANDQANMVLAFGGSPVMADSIKEVSEITDIADALVLNFGTVNDEKFNAMKISAQKANSKGIPIILDPVGIGVSKYRRECISEILKNYKVDVIKCNQSELFALADIESKSIGIDSIEENKDLTQISRQVSIKLKTCIFKTGKTDIVSDNNKSVSITGGSELLKTLTGTGCMLTSITAVSSVLIKDPFTASVFSSKCFKRASEKAYSKLEENYQFGTFKIELFNQIRKIYNEILKGDCLNEFCILDN